MKLEMKRCVSIQVIGKVQGVFFRASARDKASELGLCGFVQNATDGNVNIKIEGEEERLSQFEAWCWQGPPQAIVQMVTKEELELQNFLTFEIIR